jgi:hypothetical protein
MPIADEGRVRRDHDVTTEDQLKAARDGNAIHCGNDGLGHALDPQENIHGPAQLLGKLAVFSALQAFEKALRDRPRR